MDSTILQTPGRFKLTRLDELNVLQEFIDSDVSDVIDIFILRQFIECNFSPNQAEEIMSCVHGYRDIIIDTDLKKAFKLTPKSGEEAYKEYRQSIYSLDPIRENNIVKIDGENYVSSLESEQFE